MNQSENAKLEEWRTIKGYEDRYEVSNLGRVRSLTHIVDLKSYLLRRNNNV